MSTTFTREELDKNHEETVDILGVGCLHKYSTKFKYDTDKSFFSPLLERWWHFLPSDTPLGGEEDLISAMCEHTKIYPPLPNSMAWGTETHLFSLIKFIPLHVDFSFHMSWEFCYGFQ